MPIFTYRAIGQDGREMQGTIEAPDEDSARKALSDSHIEVSTLAESTRTKAPQSEANTTDRIAFSFEGVDLSGSPRKGVLQATSKRAAFDSITRNQGLRLTALVAAGDAPPEHDSDLEAWQTQGTAQSVPLEPVARVATPPSSGVSESATHSSYAPLLSTFSLYAGWLLAWYGFFASVGYYSLTRDVPFDVPGSQGFLYSPMILSIMLAMFMFLLFRSIIAFLNSSRVISAFVSIIGIVAFIATQALIVR